MMHRHSLSRKTKSFVWNFLKCQFKHMIEFFSPRFISHGVYMDIVPYLNNWIHVYVWNLRILQFFLKNWTVQNFTIANFRHPVSKSWLRHRVCILLFQSDLFKPTRVENIHTDLNIPVPDPIILAPAGEVSVSDFPYIFYHIYFD